MFNIIVKGRTNQAFHSHYNSALGKYVHTKEDYLKEMKKGGFVPYDEKKDYSPKRQKPELSIETKRMVSHIKSNSTKDGKFNPSTTFIDVLEAKKKGLGKSLINPNKYKATDEQMKKGGFF